MLPFVFGGVCEDEVEVELEVELLDECDELDELEELDDDDDEEDEAADEDEEVVVVLGAAVVVVVLDGVHDSDSFAIGPLTGSWIEDSGVPGGTSTLNDSVWPVTSVTVITHASAEATGNNAIPCTASNEPTVASNIVSCRRLNTVV